MPNQDKLFFAQKLPRYIFVLYLFFVIEFFLRFSSRFEFIGKMRPTLIFVVIISFFLFLNYKQIKNRIFDPISQKMNYLLLYLVISLPFIKWPGSVIANNLDMFIKAIVFLYFTIVIVDSKKRLHIFVLIFILCQLFRVLEPLYLNVFYDYWGGELFNGETFDRRLMGSPADVINANELGFVIVTIMPYLYYLLKNRDFLKKVLLILLICPLFYALILTLSRGAFLALLVICFFIFLDSRRKSLFLLAFCFIAVLIWQNLDNNKKQRYLSLVQKSDTVASKTVTGRLKGMRQEFTLAMTRPIFGYGLGTTAEAKYNLYGFYQASHNLYAQLIIETGLIGMYFFSAFIFCIYKSLKKSLSIINKNKDTVSIEISNFAKALHCLFWMYLVYSSNYWGLSSYYWYLFASLCICLNRLMKTQQGTQNAPSYKIKPPKKTLYTFDNKVASRWY